MRITAANGEACTAACGPSVVCMRHRLRTVTWATFSLVDVGCASHDCVLFVSFSSFACRPLSEHKDPSELMACTCYSQAASGRARVIVVFTVRFVVRTCFRNLVQSTAVVALRCPHHPLGSLGHGRSVLPRAA